MPRSTADRRRRIISCLSGSGLSSWLILMQPSPRAETSRFLFPNVRFCMCVVSCLFFAFQIGPDLPVWSGQVLFGAFLLHPIDGLAIQAFGNGNGHRGMYSV